MSGRRIIYGPGARVWIGDEEGGKDRVILLTRRTEWGRWGYLMVRIFGIRLRWSFGWERSGT